LLDVEFDFEKETWKGMKKYYYLVRSLSKERIHEEVKKVFSGPNPFGYVAVLDELNLLKYIFPHIVGIKNLIQPVRYHPFDVYSHTLLALHHLQSINSNYLVRLAMLYHDVGKAEQYYTHTFGLENDDRSYIYGGRLNHVNCGQDMAKEDLEKIGFSNKEIAEVMRYV
jgi:tRNA nucleotidyltransferase/poly(A) polymerase